MSEFLGFGASLLFFFVYFLGTLGLAVCVLLVLNKLSVRSKDQAVSDEHVCESTLT